MEILFRLFLVILSMNFVWSYGHSQTIRYTREFLLNEKWIHQTLDPKLFPTQISNISPEIWNNNSEIARTNSQKVVNKRKRGKKGGVRQRLRRQLHNNRIPLPSIILANVQSLRNKIDGLHGHVTHLREYRDACLLGFTETWLSASDSDASLDLTGFGAPIRLDRDSEVTHKKQGGGVCLYINRRWCNNFTVCEKLCLPDIELLSVSLRPFYLPREFPRVYVTIVYIHPRANVEVAANTISRVIQSLQSNSPDAPNIILGDFNRCNLKKTLNSFYQYVNCPTRYEKTLDLCYGSIKGAYRSVAGPPLGSSDHNTVHLHPVYKTVLRREKVRSRQVMLWNEESSLALQGCFDCTDWSVFTDSSDDIDELTDVECCYISFCRQCHSNQGCEGFS